jgi:energy-coupling factor transporter ATP-binding protein EcfA2
MTAVLQHESVVNTYRRGDELGRVLVDFDFTVHAGEFGVVTGPSGAGKATLRHVAGGLDAPDGAAKTAEESQTTWDDEKTDPHEDVEPTGGVVGGVTKHRLWRDRRPHRCGFGCLGCPTPKPKDSGGSAGGSDAASKPASREARL